VGADDFMVHSSYLVDVELWDLGERRLRERKIEDVIRYVEARGGGSWIAMSAPRLVCFGRV
jgi:hypothetical protein